MGLIAPGRWADIVLTTDLADFRPNRSGKGRVIAKWVMES
jgi:adenine deaminase